jgi:hypothetical protein
VLPGVKVGLAVVAVRHTVEAGCCRGSRGFARWWFSPVIWVRPLGLLFERGKWWWFVLIHGDADHHAPPFDLDFQGVLVLSAKVDTRDWEVLHTDAVTGHKALKITKVTHKDPLVLIFMKTAHTASLFH